MARDAKPQSMPKKIHNVSKGDIVCYRAFMAVEIFFCSFVLIRFYRLSIKCFTPAVVQIAENLIVTERPAEHVENKEDYFCIGAKVFSP